MKMFIKYDSLTGNSSVRYDLKGNYNLSDLAITGQCEDDKDIHSLYIYFKQGDKLVSELSALTFSKDIILYGNASKIKLNAYDDIYSLDKIDSTANLTYKGEVKLYQYQDYKYQSYKLEKEYYDQYLTEPFEDYIYKDEKDYIDVPVINNVFNQTDLIKEQPIAEESNEVIPGSNEISFMNVKTPALENASKDKSSQVTLPTQYQHVLKVDNKKTTSDVASTNYFYDYLKIAILIILLILALKLKNKAKEYSR